MKKLRFKKPSRFLLKLSLILSIIFLTCGGTIGLGVYSTHYLQGNIRAIGHIRAGHDRLSKIPLLVERHLHEEGAAKVQTRKEIYQEEEAVRKLIYGLRDGDKSLGLRGVKHPETPGLPNTYTDEWWLWNRYIISYLNTVKLSLGQVLSARPGEEGYLSLLRFREDVDRYASHMRDMGSLLQNKSIKELRRFHILQFAFLGAGIVVIGVSSYLMVVFVYVPIKKTSQGMRLIRQGEWGYQIPVSSSDEVGEMAQSFNQMVEAIKDKTTRLEETTNFLNSILLSSTEYSIMAMDLKGKVQAFNEGARRMYGYEPEEVVGRLGLQALFDSEVEGGLEQALSLTEKTGRFEAGIMGKRRSGELFPAHLTITLRKDELGNPIGFVAISKDVTQQKLLEKELQHYTSALEKMVEERTQALKATEERYRSLFESTKDAVFICDKEDRFLDINQAGVELFGYPAKEEILNKDFVSTFYVNPQVRQTFQEAMTSTGFIKDFELELKRKDGSRLVALMTCSLRLDEKGNIIGYEGTVRDVTEKKRREREKDVVNNVSRIIASSLELKEVYKAVSVELGKLIDFDRTSITLQVEEGHILEYIVLTKDSSSSRLSEGTTFSSSGSATEAVIKSGKPIITRDISKGLFSTDHLLYAEGIKSRVNVPLEYKGRIMGAINFGSKKMDNFREEHIELLMQVAPQLAISIENSNLFCKIRDSEEKYRDLIENAPEMIHKLDAQGRFLNANKTELEHLGYSPEEMLEMRLVDIVPREHQQEALAHLQRVVDAGHDRAECVFLTKSGERMMVEMDSTGLRDPISGRFIYARSFVRDITERKKTEEEILRLAHTVRSIGECVAIADMEGRISFVNEAFERVSGYTQEEALGEDISLLGSSHSPRDWKKDVLDKTFALGEWQGELLFRKRNKEEYPVYLFTSLVRDERGQPLALVAAFRDIAEHKRLQMELFQSEKMAAIGQLAAGVAHEIRNPLTVIGSSIYYLKDVLTNEDKNVKEHLRIIQEEINRCQRIINQLLGFSRRAKSALEECDLNTLIEDTLSLVGKELQVNNIKVVKDFHPLLPLHLNADDMKQALLNLILNARDAMPSGGTLRIATQRDSDAQVKVFISDTGCGIPKKELKRIFLPFYTTKETGRGTGLGLYSVHSAVRRAQGSIKVESSEGKGSTFTLLLPYKEGNKDGREG
ncbi:MAG: PAS domain S-box protein [Candidatus Brocadiales bacterium]|nr:PAS domain S-box protein [Candidatus Brocadiales bacterium]